MKKAKEFLKYNLQTGVYYLVFAMIACNQNSVLAEKNAPAGGTAGWSATSLNPPVVTHANNPAEPVAFAAAELRRYLGQILGTQLSADPSCMDRDRIRLHLSIRPELDLTDEGYEFRGEGKTFHITGGGPAGVVFGAYEFLRRYCGCQFSDIGPDGEYIPHKSSIEVPLEIVKRKPKLWYRGLQQYWYEDAELSRQRIDWMAKNGMNYLIYSPRPGSDNSDQAEDQQRSPGARYSKAWFDHELRPAIRQRGMKLDMNHHNLLYWLPPSRYLKEHPDWYPETDGQHGKDFNQLCICTSNPEAVNTLIENVRTYLRENSDVKIAGVIVEDGVGMCQCERCVSQDENSQDAFRKEGENRSKSRRYAKLLNAVAQAIRIEFPDVLVGGAAYVDLLWPPRDVKLEPNTVIWVALYWRDGSRPIAPENTSLTNIRLFDALQQWKSVYPGRLIAYEYYMGMCAQKSLPYPQWEVICKDWEHLKKLGVEGATVQSTPSCDNVYTLNYLSFARCGWDDQVDPARVLDDYLLGAYGSVREQVRPIFAGLNQAAREWANTKANLLPDGHSITFLLDKVGKDTIHQALTTAREKAGNVREQRQIDRLAVAVRYWEMAAEIYSLKNQADKQTDSATALARWESLFGQNWPEMENYLQGKTLAQGWKGHFTLGYWRSDIGRFKKTAEKLRAELARSQLPSSTVPKDNCLVAHWVLAGDCKDYSGNGNDGQNHGVDLTAQGPDGQARGAAHFNGRNSYIEIKSSPTLSLGAKDFTIAAWVRTEAELDDVLGDIISKYDPELRKGFNLSINNLVGAVTSVSNTRNLEFGIDNGRDEAPWSDCGHPGAAVLISALAVHDGSLYAGTCEPGTNETGHVYRYVSGTEWVDCGSPDKANTVFSLATYNGKLYAGTARYDTTGSQLSPSPNRNPGGRVYCYAGDKQWVDCGRLDKNANEVWGMSVYKGKLYAIPMYSFGVFEFDGQNNWKSIGIPGNSRSMALSVWNGHLYNLSNSHNKGARAGVWRWEGGEDWKDCGTQSGVNQTYSAMIHEGDLYVGTWPKAEVFRYGGETNWTSVGRLGSEREVMAMSVYNGKLYAGSLPLAQVYRYDQGTNWTPIGRLDRTDAKCLNRVWSMAVYQGKLFAGTLPSGHVWSFEAGKVATYDRELEPGWRQLVGVREGGQLKLYVDGKMMATSSVFNAADFDISNEKPLKIGFGARDYFNGCICDVRIYNRALTETEISGLQAVKQ